MKKNAKKKKKKAILRGKKDKKKDVKKDEKERSLRWTKNIILRRKKMIDVFGHGKGPGKILKKS